MPTQMTNAVSIRTSVAGMRSVIISSTGWPGLDGEAEVTVQDAVVAPT